MIINKINTRLLICVFLLASCNQEKKVSESDQNFAEYWEWVSTHVANFHYRNKDPIGNKPQVTPNIWAVYLDSLDYLVPVGTFNANANFPLDLVLFRPISDYGTVEFNFMLASYKAGTLFTMVKIVSGEVGWDCRVPTAELIVDEMRPAIRYIGEACNDTTETAVTVEWPISDSGEVNPSLPATKPISEGQKDGEVDSSIGIDEHSFSGNFALVTEVEENPELLNWDAGLLKGARWGGEMVLFFGINQEVYGYATGFDMDTHRFNGKYTIVSQTVDSLERVVNIILYGEDVVAVEGEEGTNSRQLAKSELRIMVKGSAVSMSGFSLLGGGDKSSAAFKSLSQEEMNQAMRGIGN